MGLTTGLSRSRSVQNRSVRIQRPVTIDVLRRISFFELARELGRQNELESHVYAARVHGEPEQQMSLLMEPKQKYRIRQRDQYATVRD